ncbi:serine hydrolase [Neptunicella marina]|uniref:Serine hydrolase n=1 Tax=Neptunicella marina TaxID=2125989 RepID=A0A8J6IV00_9ALTE|nr:serine hydrolase [Neptunicella marina]MBC3766335.1 serine hydrolase [Neptunicella marina]
MYCRNLFIFGLMLLISTARSVAAIDLSPQDEKTQQLEQLELGTLLKKYHLSGVSVAVADNYKTEIVAVAGEKEFGSGDKIDIDTAFSTASISKPVTATLALMLVEQGKLSLDKPINQYLKRWKLTDNQFTHNKPVTLRHLLSHTAGTSQGGFADFYLGDDIPTIIESLNGVKLPRYDKPVAVEFTPGSDWNYSGGGYVIVQVALEDISGKPLAQLARQMLFEPLGMRHTTMLQANQPGFLSNVARVHDNQQKIIGTGIPICPQIAPSGMWSTPQDMLKFLVDVQLALAHKKSKVISSWVAEQTTSIATLKKVGGWGLGWMRGNGAGNIEWFSHGGSNTGTGGQVMASMQHGRAIAIFGNGPNPARIPVINQLVSTIIKQQGWQQPVPVSSQAAESKMVEQLKGRYLAPYGSFLKIYQQDEQLKYQGRLALWSQQQQGEVYYAGDGLFGASDENNRFNTRLNPADNRLYLTFYRQGKQAFLMPKLTDDEVIPADIADEASVEQLLACYRLWQQRFPDSPVSSASTINRAGYQAINEKNLALAIKYLKVQTLLYPENANAYDSLGEAYQLLWNKELAIENYQKSLQLNPHNQHAAQQLQKLLQ